MGKRKFLQKKKLGSVRVDVPLKRKKEYRKRIVELKEPFKIVKKIYLEEFGKPMPYSTYDTWRKQGAEILSSGFSGVNFRGVPRLSSAQLRFFFKICNSVFRKKSILEEFEKDVLQEIQFKLTSFFKKK